MNKISKKIVALATMAAFVLTLVPAAAFAATGGAAVEDASYYEVVGGNATVEINDVVETVFNLNDNNDDPAGSGFEYVKVWATDNNAKDNITEAATFYTDKNGENALSEYNNSGVWYTENVANTDKLYVSFSRSGEYTIHAATGTFGATGTVEDLTAINTKDTTNTITVNAADVEVAKIELYGQYGANTSVTLNADNKVDEFNLIDSGFVANGTDKYTVQGYAYDKDGIQAKNQTITLTSGKPDCLQFTNDTDKDGVIEVTTDNKGFFSFTITMNDNRNVPITLSVDGQTYTLRITKEATTAYDIDTVQDGGYVLAGTDDRFDNRLDADFSDAVQFSISDVTGEAITVDLDGIEPAATENKDNTGVGALHAKYLAVTEKPAKSTLSSSDLMLVPGKDGTYTLEYQDTPTNAKKDLIPGKYTVSVSLLSGDYATATFNVAEFGTVQDTVLDMWAEDRSADSRRVAITDEVTLGQNVFVSAKYVDENGLKIDATNVNYGFDGKAVVDRDTNNGNGFATKDDIAANESLLGTTITVTAFNKDNHQLVQKKLTVVDSYNSFSLEFDPTEGAVNEDNNVTVKVVKEDGSIAQVRGTLEAYVADQSNEDAIVTVEKVKDVANGKGVLQVYASEPTEVDIVVAVDDATNEGLYAATLTYTVGADKITAHHEVVMTIGASEYVVDKQLFTMDAAPYVDSNWRTMVPIRALAEAFDATVTYDNDDRTVTIEYNEQTIVMTVDESAYTINGEEAEMDTEAVIKGDRTYVPVRFAAEAMGFTVTALYDENSSTASVVFQS